MHKVLQKVEKSYWWACPIFSFFCFRCLCKIRCTIKSVLWLRDLSAIRCLPTKKITTTRHSSNIKMIDDFTQLVTRLSLSFVFNYVNNCNVKWLTTYLLFLTLSLVTFYKLISLTEFETTTSSILGRWASYFID